MKKDILKNYVLEILLFVILFFALIVLNNVSYMKIAVVLLVFALNNNSIMAGATYFIKDRRYKKWETYSLTSFITFIFTFAWQSE